MSPLCNKWLEKCGLPPDLEDAEGAGMLETDAAGAVNPLPLPESLSIDRPMVQLLTRVAETEELSAVREIKLRVISREMSLQRLNHYLPVLQELDLSGSCLATLRDLGCELTTLKVLRVARCGLDSLDGVIGLPNLEAFFAPHNAVKDISYCAFLADLRLLDLSSNRISNLDQAGFLSICSELRDLFLVGNTAASLPNYRSSVASLLPQITTLDGLVLSSRRSEEGPSGSDANSCSESSSQEEDICLRNDRQRGPDVEDLVQEVASMQISWDPEANEEALRRRPATTGGFVSRSEMPCRRRPVTSHAVRNMANPVGTVAETGSLLTSGMVVCGNLAASLKARRRRHQEAEKEAMSSRQPTPPPAAKKVGREPPGRAAGDRQDTWPNCSGGEEGTDGRPASAGDTLMEASRQYRAAFRSFRSSNRKRWEQEAKEVLGRSRDGYSEVQTKKGRKA